MASSKDGYTFRERGNMAGIKRVHITDVVNGRGAWRFRDSRRLWPAANQLYRDAFADIGMPLADGDEELECSKDGYDAGYDSDLGIDVLLTFANGQTATMQEKFLFTKYNTVTVEYYQNPAMDIEGDWFTMKCQYYFVGYDFPKTGRRFSTWVLLDWPRLQLATAQERVYWQITPNKHDGARANFKHTPIHVLPADVVIAASNGIAGPCQDRFC